MSTAFTQDSIYFILKLGVVVCPLQPSSSVNSGCPGPESSILVSSRWACVAMIARCPRVVAALMSNESA